MSSVVRTVARNASLLMVSQVITWSLGLFLWILLPRFLGPSAIGKFHLATSIWAMLGILVTFGLDVLITKEVARSTEGARTLLGTTLALRMVFFVLALGLLTVYLLFVDYPPDTVVVIYLVGISNFIAMLGGVGMAVLQGLERMEYVALANTVHKVLNVLIAIGLVLMGHGIVAVAAVGIFTGVVYLLFPLVGLKRTALLSFGASWRSATKLLSAGIPYVLSTVFFVFYVQMDIVIISLLIDEQTVGWYAAADHFFGALMVFPAVLMAAMFPPLSRMYHQSSEALWPFVRRTLHWVLLLAVPIGIGVGVLATPIVVLLYGPQFENSGAVLAVNGLVVILMYINIFLGRSLIAMDRQNAWTKLMAVATFVTIPLDVLLIPWCHQALGNGAVGGAIAYVVTEGGMMVIGLRMLPAGMLTREDAVLATRILAAGLLMGLAVWWWRDLFIAIPIVVGMVSYPALLLLLRAVPEEDMIAARWLGHGVATRVRVRISGSEVGSA